MKQILLSFFIVLIASIHANENEILLQNLEQGLQELAKTNIFPKYLNETLKKIQIAQFRNTDDELDENIICSGCYIFVNYLIDERRYNNASLDSLTLLGALICTIFKIEPAEICRSFIDLNLPIFVYMVDQNPDLKGERMCDIIFQDSGCNNTNLDWTIEIPEGRTVDRKEPSNPETYFNVLHISDFHYDPLYQKGKSKICKNPVCCQSDQEDDGNENNDTACGYWSEYHHVDSSEALIDESIRKANEFEFDYVYFTGDIVSHRVWSTSIEKNTRDIKLIFKKMKETFKQTPIYPILGNHEPTPLNEFAIEDNVEDTLSTEWLYKLIISEFSELFPESAQKDILKGGYYSVSPKKGFRIIALNSNVAYRMNWWLIKNDVDPFDQLTWLANTLKEAEDSGEIVHILSHIPSGSSDLLQVWSREYHKIIERFSNTIAAQFNGHTHKDQFMVYYSSLNTSEVINVAINGASVNSDQSNPSFKIINVDNENYDIINTDEWTFNLTEANLLDRKIPDWYKLYSFRENYKIKSLAAKEFSELLPRMAKNHQLLADYHKFRYRNSDVAVENTCDNFCKKHYLCEIATSKVGDNVQCEILKKIFNDNI